MKNFLISAAVCVIVLYGLDTLLFGGRYTTAMFAIGSQIMR